MKKKAKKQRTRLDWEIEINLKAWKDPEFKKALLRNTRETLEELECHPVLDPNSTEILEEGENEQIIVLHQPPTHMSELAKGELNIMAGSGVVSLPTTCPRRGGCRTQG